MLRTEEELEQVNIHRAVQTVRLEAVAAREACGIIGT